VFGSIAKALGPEVGWVGTHQYLAVSFPIHTIDPGRWSVDTLRPEDHAEFHSLVVKARGSVFLTAEELTVDDIELGALDDIYREAGLRRYRRIFVARDRESRAVQGAALAYRGPLGLNFSFLENRCDLIIEPTLTAEQAGEVANALLRSVAETYADFLPAFIPVVTDKRASQVLVQQGGELIRQYAQSIWLPDGYEGWYRHVESFYNRLTRIDRNGVEADRSGQPGGQE
jgi:hypothetical protein